jgi:UDP-N-acetylmuramate-alanine ligase
MAMQKISSGGIEYDTAFCDKRSKFVHYGPRTALLNNLEFDHADIFEDLAAIETQFHHLVRIVPRSGLVLANGGEAALERVLERGERIELLVDKTDNLRFQADKFHKTGRALRTRMWWQNFKVQIIVLLIIVLIAVIIFCSVCFSGGNCLN